MENNKLTPKQRAKIYKECCKAIEEDKTEYICLYLRYATPKIKKEYDSSDLRASEISIKYFPEIALFKPKNCDIYDGWFDINEEGKQQRITALLFAYQMALDATK